MLSMKQAFDQWQELAQDLPSDDRPMRAESWHCYVDSLQKDGELTALQSHYDAPLRDDLFPSDLESEIEEILTDGLGVKFSIREISKRTDGAAFGKTHWAFIISRGAIALHGEFSQGAAHVNIPTILDVFPSVILDSQAVEDCDDILEFAEEWGYELSTHDERENVRRAWKACRHTNMVISEMFTVSEIADLSEMINEAGL